MNERNGVIKITFISNFINHHQIPFCNEMYKALGDSFSFIEVQPMEESRKNMGWSTQVDDLGYLHRMYEEEETCARLIESCDVLLLGWTGLDKDSAAQKLISRRLDSKKPVIRVSERIYREGRWKAISPRGLKAKFDEHVRYRNDPVYMLCAGAYVSGDFNLIGAYPGKMFKWGYFPPLRRYDDDKLKGMLYKDGEELRICYASRMIKLKHPEFIMAAAEHLKVMGMRFHIDAIGDGPLLAEIKKAAADKGLSENITFHGSMKPDEVRDIMEASHVFIFTSNYLEGWGAVVNEAMNSVCAVVASKEAGAVPYLIKDGENGLTYDDGRVSDFIKKLDMLSDGDMIRRLQLAAYKTIESCWNAEIAAGRLLSFCKGLTTESVFEIPTEGPMSRAEIIRAPGFLRTLREDNHLE